MDEIYNSVPNMSLEDFESRNHLMLLSIFQSQKQSNCFDGELYDSEYKTFVDTEYLSCKKEPVGV